MSTQVSIPRRFNGPLGSGNGGYCSGVFAALVDGHAAVNLRRPIPLDCQLDVVSRDGEARVTNGEELIAEVQPCPPPAIDVPDPVDPERARAATSRYRGAEDGVFSECFVCGLAREDSLGVFAGPVEGRELVASPWQPPEWTGGEDDAVRPELVWAVLDCPTVFAAFLGSDEYPLAYLVRMNAELRAPVPVDGEYVAVAWPAWCDGRKHRAGSALFSVDGELLAVADALMIEPA
ncbi:MAG TPA: hypothetical protein VMT37_09245 [Solirubrobacterales bacterium]|nr:hypothetical protein [Solirubrobacterales bacterium]